MIIKKNTWPSTNFQQLFVKSAPQGSYYAEFVGHVLLGDCFTEKFTLEQISKFDEYEKKKYPDAENLYVFTCGGYITFNLSDIVLLDSQQFCEYKGKLAHGNKLQLGDREDPWLTWDSYMKKLYVTDRRDKERLRMQHAVTAP